MSDALTEALRRYVAEGAGLHEALVIVGNDDGPRPTSAYATVLLLTDDPVGYPIRRQLDGGQTAELLYHEAEFSVQFYRAGAVGLARTFRRWAMSELGLTQAETAFADGHLDGVLMVGKGSGYDDVPQVTFTGGGGAGAAGTAVLVNGTVDRVRLTARGENYYDSPHITFEPRGSPPTEPATASAYGFGMRVKFPLRIQRIDAVTGPAWEERALINVGIAYGDWHVQETGEIDTVESGITYGTLVDTVAVDIPE